MNGKLQQDITDFLGSTYLNPSDLLKNLKQARELLVRAVNEPDRNWYIRELAEYQASMCNNAEKDGIVIQHFQGAYNDYSDNQLKRTYEAQKAVFKSESN
jgi:N-acetyl-anhydromuramyl-L-alanine amidase AmpD